MKKRLVSLALSVSLALTCMPFALADNAPEFQRTKSYEASTFSDVASNQWYAEWVKNAYELGLVSGKSGGKFDPNGLITIGETITIACTINSIYTGKTIEKAEGEWYQMYVNYAIANGIIRDGTYANYKASATRAQFAEILAACLPEDTFTKINNITAIPDVDRSASYADAVYTLYNAGITKGTDKYGTYNPKDNIQRSAVSVIVAKIAASSLRETFTLTTAKDETSSTSSSDSFVSEGEEAVDDKNNNGCTHPYESYTNTGKSYEEYNLEDEAFRTYEVWQCSVCGEYDYREIDSSGNYTTSCSMDSKVHTWTAWTQQNGSSYMGIICSYCHQKCNTTTAWHAHRNNQHSGCYTYGPRLYYKLCTTCGARVYSDMKYDYPFILSDPKYNK